MTCLPWPALAARVMCRGVEAGWSIRPCSTGVRNSRGRAALPCLACCAVLCFTCCAVLCRAALQIHTSKMTTNSFIGRDVDLYELAQLTKNFRCDPGGAVGGCCVCLCARTCGVSGECVGMSWRNSPRASGGGGWGGGCVLWALCIHTQLNRQGARSKLCKEYV